uniref:Glutamate decarboxylase 1b n=1 Tax=Oncorhynchus kisutch TaxID=8019 RepID=A0A8C7LKG9_ONCKI
MLGSGNQTCSPTHAAPCNTIGFLQKNNSLGEEGRLAGSLSERQKNLFSCVNSDRDARFCRTETDFSNMFARGKPLCSSYWNLWTSSPTTSGSRLTVPPRFWTSTIRISCLRAWRASTSSSLTSQSPLSRSLWTAGTRSSTASDHVQQDWIPFIVLSCGNVSLDCAKIRRSFILSLSTGGAISNMYSVMIARYKYFPEVKTKGMSAAPRLVLFTSEHSHYSIKKAGAALGFGSENVVLLSTDERGRVIPADLEAKILDVKQKGYHPLFVNATAGSTVYGAFDPINEIADICEKYNMWLHVDGAWGGGLLMSRKHRHKFSGVERANSVTWNPHKMMGVPLQCSAILVREKGILAGCNSMCAGYLFQPDKQYDVSYDTGDKAIQCGRHVDIFKFWLMWKAKGTIGFEQHIDKCLDLSQYLYDKIRNREGYEMVFDGVPQHTNVCFWYIPPSLRGMEHNSKEYREKLHKVAPNIKAMMMESGTTMVGYQPQGQKVNFFRMVISNPAALQSDIDFLIDEIERLGRDL